MEECEPRFSAVAVAAVAVVVAYVCPGAGLAPDIQLKMKVNVVIFIDNC